MCLILLAWQSHSHYPLLVAANRDEYYRRRTREAAFWPGNQGLLAGKDLEAGGTWLGLRRSGRFAAITNFRGEQTAPAGAPSRGLLPLEFLRGTLSAGEYARQLLARGQPYAGFNLLLMDGRELVYCSNVDHSIRSLAPGIYGLSNALLDTPWPKVEWGRAQLAELITLPAIQLEQLANAVSSRRFAADHELPDTGIGLEAERWLSAQFIRADDYGTRATTGLSVDEDGVVRFLERNFGPQGQPSGEQRLEFRLEGDPPYPAGRE